MLVVSGSVLPGASGHVIPVASGCVPSVASKFVLLQPQPVLFNIEIKYWFPFKNCQHY